MTWAKRKAEPDYQGGSIEARQKIQQKWFREWEDWSDSYYKKKTDQRAFKDKLYEAVPREKLPTNTWGDVWNNAVGDLVGGTVHGVARAKGYVAEVFGMEPTQDPNSFWWLFTEKGGKEFDDAFLSGRASERRKELEKIKAERMKAVEGEGLFAGVGAMFNYIKDYPEAIVSGVIQTVPLMAELAVTAPVAGAVALVAGGRMVAAGVMSVAQATKLVQAAQTVGVAVPYGAATASEVYDGVRGVLREIPPEAWKNDPGYQEFAKRNTGKSHDELVELISADRAFWPSLFGGAFGAVTSLVGGEKALVTQGAKEVAKRVAARVGTKEAAEAAARVPGTTALQVVKPLVGEPLQEIGEAGVQGVAEEANVGRVAPELVQTERIGQQMVEAGLTVLPLGAAGAARIAVRRAGEAPGKSVV